MSKGGTSEKQTICIFGVGGVGGYFGGKLVSNKKKENEVYFIARVSRRIDSV